MQAAYCDSLAAEELGLFLSLASTPVACCAEANRQEESGQGEEMEREPAFVSRQSTGSACCSHMGMQWEFFIWIFVPVSSCSAHGEDAGRISPTLNPS